VALHRILNDAHLAPAEELPAVVGRAAERIGAFGALLLVPDHQQVRLVDLAGEAEPYAVDGSVAGLAHRRGTVEHDGSWLWVPLLDGIDRVGVLGLRFDEVDEQQASEARRIASLTAELVITKSLYSDTLHRRARSQDMTLAAEMQWDLIPPLTAGTERATIAAMLEPAYSVGGDLFDYSLESDRIHVAILDAMGHGIAASLCSSLAVGALRNARRSGKSLEEAAAAMEAALFGQFAGERFATAIIADLDTDTGRLRWLNAGHPPPLLLRGGRVVKELHVRGTVPLGLGLPHRAAVSEEQLEPGDRVLLYTDGVIEHRPAGGAEQFGVEGLVDFLVRADASGEDLPETMRRLSQRLVELHDGNLRDDASQVLVEWRGGGAQEIHRRFAGDDEA
jgi:serine phosphatase RsbU (regulator of sigma subunit)